MERKVDVIIPTYHPDDKFRVLMRMLRRQTCPIHKIIVMNTGDVLKDEEHYMAHSAKHNVKLEVNHIPPEEFDHGGTRNVAAMASTADILVFLTQDAVPADEYLIERLVAPFDQYPNLAISYGRQLAAPDCGVIEAYTRSFNYPDKSFVKTGEDIPRLGIKTFFASNVCAAYHRDIYDELGGFVTKTIFNEDMIYAGKAIQAGYGIAYAADARVIHSHNYSNIKQFKRNFDLAVSQKDHPEIFNGIKSESEGLRLVKQTASYLWKHRKGYLIPSLIIKSGCKYIGYFLGKRYDRLPFWLIKKCTMNKRYWRDYGTIGERMHTGLQ